jgi:hypothetical protein
MKKTILTTILLLGISQPVFFAQEGGRAALMVGAAKVSITPPDHMFPMKSFQSFISAHDTLFVRTIVLDNGIEKAALISLDLLAVPDGAAFINSIADELGADPSKIFISAIHSHNTPFAVPPPDRMAPASRQPSFMPVTADAVAYYELVRRASLQSVREAMAGLQQACVGFAEGKAYINTNRDQKIGEGYHMGYNPDGPTDKTVAVISFTTREGRPIALYANYPVHSVAMFLAKTREGMAEVTGDIGGATSAYVENRLGGVIALWTMGAAGDQNPLFMANYNQDAPDVFDEGTAGYAILDVQARRLGEEIVRLASSIKNVSSEVSIWSRETTVSCPGRKREKPPEPGVPAGGYLAPVNVRMTDGDPVSVPIRLLMINDIALAGVSGEVFTEIGIHLKQQSIFDRTVMVTNLPDGVGYIPTEAAYLMPSEKAMTSRLKPGAETKLIGAFVELMNEYIDTGISARQVTDQ